MDFALGMVQARAGSLGHVTLLERSWASHAVVAFIPPVLRMNKNQWCVWCGRTLGKSFWNPSAQCVFWYLRGPYVFAQTGSARQFGEGRRCQQRSHFRTHYFCKSEVQIVCRISITPLIILSFVISSLWKQGFQRVRKSFELVIYNRFEYSDKVTGQSRGGSCGQ